MNTTIYTFEFGYITITHEGGVLYSLKCSENPPKTENAVPHDNFSDYIYSAVLEYLSGGIKKIDVPYRLTGSEFRCRVWNELLKIPYGEVRTYGEIAAAAGNKKAARAVGAANNQNPIHIIVPCHRVIGSDGSLVGYAGGLRLKEKLLKVESAAK